jgi:small subunit ribosomal protein S9
MTNSSNVTQEYIGTGRRKTAVARIRMTLGSGKVLVNGRPFEEYFNLENIRIHALEPLKRTELLNKFDIKVNVTGGGQTGQAGAIRLGIARALLQFDANLRPLLRSEGFLTRDPRMKERKKYGQPGARKRFQFSKR